MSNTPSPASGTPPSVSGKSSWHSRLRESKTLSRTAPLVTNTGLLAFIAPLLQAEVGIAIWITLLAGALLFLAAFIFLPDRPLLRAWFRWTFYLTVIGVIAVLAVLPFYRMPARTYVAVTGEGLSFFDPQRYISDSVILSPEAGVVIANHPAHRAVAGILYGVAHVNDPGQRWATPLRWLGGLTRNFFQGDILFLTPASRKGDKVVPLTLGREHMESWTDLAGSPCKSYEFTLRNEKSVTFLMEMTRQYKKNSSGKEQMGTRFQVNLSPQAESQMTFSLVSRQEVLQWNDVPLYNDFDTRTALYIARLTELLNSPQLRADWAVAQCGLWETVPNDRERLRLLLLRSRLDAVVADGNVFKSQLLPDLIRIESILAMSISSSEALVQDQLLYWGAREFIQISDFLKDRFSARVGILEKLMAGASPALDPVFLDSNRFGTKEVLKEWLSRQLPAKLWAHKQVQNIIASILRGSSDMPSTPSPVNPKRAWMNGSEWSHLKALLPGMNLKSSPLTQKKREGAAASSTQSPALEDAWETAETAFWLEYFRRVLLHAGEDLNKLAETGLENDVQLSRTFTTLAEGMLLQQPFLEELPELRQRLFGDSAAYLQQAPHLNALKAASEAYAQPPQAASVQDISRVKNLLEGLSKLLKNPLITGFFNDETMGDEFNTWSAEPLKWLNENLRQAKIIQAWFSLLDTRAFTTADPGIFGTWLPWMKNFVSDPALDEIIKKLNQDEEPAADLFRQLEKHALTAPMNAEDRQHLTGILSRLTHLAELAVSQDPAAEKASLDQRVELTADGILLVRNLCRQSKVLTSVAELIDQAVYTNGYTLFVPPGEQDGQTVTDLRAALRKRLPLTPENSAQSPTEQRLWRLMTRLSWFSNLPAEQRPRAIIRDEVRGVTTLDPPCPELEAWIHTVITADTNGPEGSAYPYVSEALILELLLRTLEDRTPVGYRHTEFGQLWKIFETLTSLPLENYLGDCLRTTEVPEPSLFPLPAGL